MGTRIKAGPHQESVRKGIEWLKGMQRPTGEPVRCRGAGKEAHYYSHAQSDDRPVRGAGSDE